MSSKRNGSPLPLWVAAIHALSRAFGVFSAGLIVVAIVVVCHMVFVRAVLNQSTIWQTDFVTFALIAATFLGSPYILMARAHVCVDVLPLMLGPLARRRLYLFGSTIALAFCLVFLYAAIPWWWEAWVTERTTSSIWRLQIWIATLAVPLGLILLCLQYITEIWLALFHHGAPEYIQQEERS